jgi:hypothetical protein
VTNLVLSLAVALAALYAADRAGWLPELGSAVDRSDTTRSVEIAEPVPQAPEPAALPSPEPVIEEGAAPPPPFESATPPPEPALEPAAEIEIGAASPPRVLTQPERSAELVRRMLSLYRRSGERH